MNTDKAQREATGPRGFPLLGHIPQFLYDRLGFLCRCADQYGDVVKLKIGELTYLLNNPEDIKHVLVTNSENFDKGPRLSSPRGKRLSGNGLVTSSGSAHLRQRRMMQPVFYRTSIQAFAETITNETEQKLAAWKGLTEVNIREEMMSLAKSNIIKTVFGKNFEDRTGQLGKAITIRRTYLNHVYFSLLPFPEYIPPQIARAYRQAVRNIEETLYREINRRREKPCPPHDMLSLLMHAKYEDGTGMADQQILDEVLTVFSAGLETTGDALTWTWYLLSQHGDIQSKFLVELEEVLEGRVPGVGDLPKLRYTALVLAESLRLFPPTWLFVRTPKNKDVLPSGISIPAGSKLYLCPYVMHRNSHYWSNPEEFNPERFTESAKKERPQFSYFPFGGGIRFCIGEAFAKMQILLVLATIAQRFTLNLVPGQTIVPKPRLTLRPQKEIRMRLDQRDQGA